MATSSITKDFYVKDRAAFEKLCDELKKAPQKKQVVSSPSLAEGKRKLATFSFR